MSRSFTAENLEYKYLGVLLFCLFCALYIACLGIRPLFIPDEVRYGEIAREMLVSGNWTVPRLNGLLYFEKPPFGHWVNAISLYVFGENPFAVRFASAMASGVSALTVWAIGRLYFESRNVAYLAVFIFLTMFEVQAVGTFSVLDSLFSAVLNAGIALYAFAAMVSGPRRYAYLSASGGFFGIAFLTKGFLGFALPVIVLVPWLLSTRQFYLLFRESWFVVVVAVVVVAPWGLAIHAAQPDFWRYFFWVEHIQRFTAENAQHKAPPYYFLAYLPIVAFPWFFLMPAAMTALRQRDKSVEYPGGMLLLVLWTVVPFVFFSIASGKLITYILPCFVPASLILAIGLSQRKMSMRGVQYGIAAMSLLLILALFATLYVSFLGEAATSYQDAEGAKLAGLVAALLASVSILIYGACTARALHRLLSPGVAIAIILMILPPVIPNVSLERKAPVEFIRHVYAQVPERTAIVTNGSLVRAVSWATQRDDVLVIENKGETSYGLNAADARGRFLSPDDLRALLSNNEYVLVICKGQCQEQTLAVLQNSSSDWRYGNFFAYFAASG